MRKERRKERGKESKCYSLLTMTMELLVSQAYKLLFIDSMSICIYTCI